MPIVSDFDMEMTYPEAFEVVKKGLKPLGERYAQLGPVRIRWEEGLTATAETIEIKDEPWSKLWNGALYRLTLTTDEPVNGGEYTFTLNALRTFG